MKNDELKEQFKKRIYTYMIRLVKFLGSLPQTIVIREIISQVMRSGTSIGANYFEAQAASSRKDYQNFFNHSLKSANESIFWLLTLKNSDLVPHELVNDLNWLLQETQELANIFASSILTMKNR